MPKVIQVPTAIAEAYPLVGEYRGDNGYLPHYNQSTTATILPGEPVLKKYGDEQRVMISARRIEPLEVGNVHLNWVADFPCDLSATVYEGEALYFDPEATSDAAPVGQVVLEGDAEPGAFFIGYASYAQIPGQKPAVGSGGNAGKVICGTTSSTQIRVVSVDVDPDVIPAPTTTTTGG